MKDLSRLTTVDFETEAVGPRPKQYPPKPVGVAIRWPTGRMEYLAWGHPQGNNCTYEEAERAVRMAFEKGPVLCHNAKFDLEVAYEHMGIPFPKVWHDTLLLAFLQSPDEPTFALKPMAEKFLGMPPEQQDVVHEWIIKNVPGATKKTAGAFICKAPVALVGPYAIGDVERTFKLFQYLYPPVNMNMPEAYDRERRLMPHLVAAEKRGIRVDRNKLMLWQVELSAALSLCDVRLRAYLNDPTLNFDSDNDLANALEREKLVDHWETPDGTVFPINGSTSVEANPFAGAPSLDLKPPTRSMSRSALQRCCTDKTLVNDLYYRNTAATLLRMFIEPWLEYSKHDGRLHTEWAQTRGQEKDGTRTGRIASARPNLANVPNVREIAPPFGLPPLPALRTALLPEEGCYWVSADYSQQELRIAAHYEDGEIQNAYRREPALDLHLFAQKLIKERVGLDVERKKTKTVAFASIYGAGVTKLAAQMGVTEDEAYTVREAYFAALPGLRNLVERVKQRVKEVGFVRSRGGRLLPVEAPKIIKGKWRSFEYKMANKMIQGSAADQTKEAIVAFCEGGGSGLFLSQVYDEINISAPYKHVQAWGDYLRHCMVNALPLDVPVLVDLEVGDTWGTIK